MMKYADLHIHTHYSDSTFSPEEVIALAGKKALSAIAICDHDCVAGIEPTMAAVSAANADIEIIPGIEITVEKQDAEIHILGYFIDYKAGWFLEKLKEIQDARIERIHKMVEKLNEAGIALRAEEVFALGGKGTVGRLHLAQAMLNTGKVKSFREVFGEYIGFQKKCYVPHVKFSPEEAINTILRAGGVPAIAHPALMGRDEYISELTGYGLRAIEVYHTDHKPSMVKHYEEFAASHGLLMTGGSDCHGMGKGRPLIGIVRIPYELVDKIREEAEKIRNEHR